MKHTVVFALAGVLMGLLTSLVGLPMMVEYAARAGIYLLLMDLIHGLGSCTCGLLAMCIAACCTGRGT